MHLFCVSVLLNRKEGEVAKVQNWLTIIMLIIVVGSAVYGSLRGFGNEMRHVVFQLIHVMVISAAIVLAWLASERALNVVHRLTPQSLPLWLTHLLTEWQKAPRIGNLVVFLIIYFILSNLLFAIFRPLVAIMPRPAVMQRSYSRFFGCLLGIAVGAVRATVVGAIVFVATSYLSLPFLSDAANISQPYQALRSNLYQPWLKPLVTRELPVLAQGALQPIAQNIALFAVPTGANGAETGVLVIPKQIAAKAHQITNGLSSPTSKAKALYEWEIHHVSYSWKKYDDYVYHNHWDAQSPLQTLKTGKGVCADFALLYADLAHASGLNVRIDEGLAGTASSYGSHAWNEVYIPAERQWILVDTTWGSEQDAWFDVPAQVFDQTHETQRVITIHST